MFGVGGKTLWSYGGGRSGVDDVAAGTLGPDASKRVVADSTAMAGFVY
jgi:hypothetical protein